MCLSTKLSPFSSWVEYMLRVLYCSLLVILISSLRRVKPSSDSKNCVVLVLISPSVLNLQVSTYGKVRHMRSSIIISQFIVKVTTSLYTSELIRTEFNMAKKRNRHSADIKRALKKKLRTNNQRNERAKQS